MNVYFIVAIIVCALGMEPRALQMPNQNATTDLPSAQYTSSDLSCIRWHWKGPLPSKSTYFQNHFPLLLFITAFCSVVLRNRTENHHVTLAKLTLQGSATSTCIIPREEKKRSVPGSRWEYHHETNKDMQICLSHSSFAWCFFGFAEPQY